MHNIFIDLDGVMFDLESALEYYVGPDFRELDKQDKMWDKVNEKNPHIFRHLSTYSGAFDFLLTMEALARWNHYQVSFLTAIPRTRHVPNAASDKIDCVIDNFGDKKVIIAPYSADKKLHCKNDGDILIDDKIENIREWPGLGILHTSFADTVRRLSTLSTWNIPRFLHHFV